VDPLPLALGRPGGAGVAKFVDELILSAENELHYRGLGRSASGEARLAVWREVLSVFATHMPACSTLLTRVLAEFDSALRTLQGEVEAVESKLAEAWQAQQRAEQSAFTVRRESEKRVASAVAQSEAHEKAKRAFQRAAQLAEREARKRAQEARASSQLSVEVVLGSVRELSEPLRLDCLSRAVVEALPARLQTPLLVRLLRHVARADRFAAIAQTLQPGDNTAPLMLAKSTGDDGDVHARLGALPIAEDETSENIESLLDAMPEALRAQIAVRAMRSLSPDVRANALCEL